MNKKEFTTYALLLCGVFALTVAVNLGMVYAAVKIVRLAW